MICPNKDRTLVDESEAFVTVAGGQVYVKQWVPDEGARKAPIVLFHDSIGCVDMWRTFPRSLASRLQRRVIAYDRVGFGRSSARVSLPTIRFVTEEAEIYFPEIARALGLAQFAVFGHSVGGAMAIMVAIYMREQCFAVVTESSQAFVEQQTLASIAAAKIKFSDSKELEKLVRYHGAKARWVVDAWTETWLTPAFLKWSLVPELPSLAAPLLAIHGEADEYGSVDFPKTLSSNTSGPAEMLVFKGCGHVPHRERESEVLNAVDRFISAGYELGLERRGVFQE